jgi:hypothetical protein
MPESKYVELFRKYENASDYAFGRVGSEGIVAPADKLLYWEIYQKLISACEDAVGAKNLSEHFYVKPCRLSQDRGVRGHRPLDLWCAIRNKGSEVFGEMPQVYVISSARGIEIGFAVSIPESDYHDQAVKAQNREIIPHIHRKLPTSGPIVEKLDELLNSSALWHVNEKTRLVAGDEGFNTYRNASDLFLSLKKEVVCKGGGAICQIIPATSLSNGPFDITAGIKNALEHFADIMIACSPSQPDIQIGNIRAEVLAQNFKESFDPDDLDDAKERSYRAIASRRGQPKFRTDLFGLYDGTCAVTGCRVSDVIEAAHIIPYNGKRTNHIENGLLLRSDVHNLFDHFLISIDPSSLQIRVSQSLQGSEYMEFDGKYLKLPVDLKKRPSSKALEWHFSQFIK